MLCTVQHPLVGNVLFRYLRSLNLNLITPLPLHSLYGVKVDLMGYESNPHNVLLEAKGEVIVKDPREIASAHSEHGAMQMHVISWASMVEIYTR